MAAGWVMTDGPCEFDRLSGGTLLVAPDTEDRLALDKDISKVWVLFHDKLSAKVVGKRVSWRRPGAMSPLIFNQVKKTVEVLEGMVAGSRQLLDVCVLNMAEFAEQSENIEHVDTVYGLKNRYHGTDCFFDKGYRILAEYEDVISSVIMAQADFLEGTYTDRWIRLGQTISHIRGVSDPDNVRKEVAAKIWVSTVQEHLRELYTYIICERYYLDDNLIYTDRLSRKTRSIIKQGEDSLDYRTMLNRKMQRLFKNKVSFFDFNHLRDRIYYDKNEMFRSWQSQNWGNHEIHRYVIFSEDHRVLVDFKLRFG